MDTSKQKHWSSIKEAGTLFGLQFLRLVHQVFGRWLVSLMLLPTVAYFMVFRPNSRRSSLDYLQAHYAVYPERWSKAPGLMDTAKHFYVFAQTVVDKLLSWFIDIDVDQFVIEHPDRIDELMADQRGQLIIGSHMGNLEYCRGFMQRYRSKVINILVHDKHSENYNTLMQQLNPDSRLNVFQVAEFDIAAMLKIKAKIDAGEWVFIAGDRLPLSGEERTVEVDFLNRKAQLPVGPYMLAKGLACPVKLMFSYCDYISKNSISKDHGNKEHIDNRQAGKGDRFKNNAIHFEVVSFSEKIILNRKNREQDLQQYAQSFATALEQQCAKAPLQWFNFYDFWAQK